MTSKNAHANIAFNENGTPYSLEFDDVYFSNDNGLEESRYVFVDGNQIKQRWETQDHIHIAETGFGTGLNFFATWLTLIEAFDEQVSISPLSYTFTSFEKFPLNKQDLTAALKCWPQIQEQAEQLLAEYPETVTEDITLSFASHETKASDGTKDNNENSHNITLNILIGDVNQRISNLIEHKPSVNAWYLDGFAPSKNPDMWTQSLFQQMAKTCCNEATLATFTAAGFVRRGLIDAGFIMTKRKGFRYKREMLIGAISNSAQTI